MMIMADGGDLPDEMMIEILSRLPVKSLVRFKCVCKSWRSLLQNHTFATKHLNNSGKRADSLFLRYYTHELDKYSYSLLSSETLDVIETLDFGAHIEFDDTSRCLLRSVACCNGIVCLEVCRSGDIYLWNPATRQFRKLIRGPKSNHANGYNYGFGYDAKGNDYKVIRLPYYDHTSLAYRAHIYELSSNTWRICDATVPIANYSRDDAHRVYTNGIYSWLANHINSRNRFIVSFDMSKDVFITTELPDRFKEIGTDGSLVALKKCIVLLILPDSFTCNDYKGEILVLNDYGVKESWTKLYTLRPSVRVLRFPMGCWENGDILGATVGEKLVVLNSKTQEITNVPQLDSLLVTRKRPWIWFYKESLVPII